MSKPYGICLDYRFTRVGQEALAKGISMDEVLKPEYKGIYYRLQVINVDQKLRDKYDPLLNKLKKELHKDLYIGNLEDKVRLRDKKYHSRS